VAGPLGTFREHGSEATFIGVRYLVRAHNTATESANKIHDDSVARGLGFRGGLVPGVDVFAYLCHLPAQRWGRDWLERGTIEARFGAPVYDGDEVTVSGDVSSAGSMSLALHDPGGTECASATATLPPERPLAVDVAAWPVAPLPDDPPPASEESLTAGSLGQLEATFRADRAGEYLDDVREHLALFRDEGLAHPGWLLRFANYVLASNVRLGPWIHVASRLQLLGAVTDGDLVQTRALVTGVSERKGHRFVDLDVLQVVDEQAVARTHHTAIYQPRGVVDPDGT
jgi:hypothetical protein